MRSDACVAASSPLSSRPPSAMAAVRAARPSLNSAPSSSCVYACAAAAAAQQPCGGSLRGACERPGPGRRQRGRGRALPSLRSNSRRAVHCAASSRVRRALAWMAASASAVSRTSARASAILSSMWCEFHVRTCQQQHLAMCMLAQLAAE